jgi:hypothetical protein
MNTNMNTANPDRKKMTVAISVIVLTTLTILLLFSLNRGLASPTPVQGIYRIYSNDPAIRLYIQDQNTYIKLNADRTIVYSTTINGKPKFHFEGTYTQQDNEIAIKWKEGKLPSKLTIEKKGDDHIIKVGSTMYKKEKHSS